MMLLPELSYCYGRIICLGRQPRALGMLQGVGELASGLDLTFSAQAT